MAIGIDTFDLSMTSPDTGRYLTANFYTVDGVTNADGSLRQLSIGQLVMAICLNRASKLETDIIALMEEMNSTSAQLAAMTQIEEDILDGGANMDNISTSHVTYNGTDYTFYNFLVNVLGMSSSAVPTGFVDGSNTDFITALEANITALEAKMDEKNTFSQQKMIELQSLTNKRDQSYDMISNVLKSLNTVLVGNANNM